MGVLFEPGWVGLWMGFLGLPGPAPFVTFDVRLRLKALGLLHRPPAPGIPCVVASLPRVPSRSLKGTVPSEPRIGVIALMGCDGSAARLRASPVVASLPRPLRSSKGTVPSEPRIGVIALMGCDGSAAPSPGIPRCRFAPAPPSHCERGANGMV